MADTSARFIFSKGTKKSIGTLEFDAFITESHERVNDITMFPVEDGSSISDHIISQPRKLKINAIIEAGGDGSNVLNSFNILNEIMDNKELVSVVTGLKVYTNYNIDSLTIPRDKSNGGSLTVNIELTEIRNVKSQTVVIPITQLNQDDGKDPTNKQSQGEQDNGKATNGQTTFSDELEQIRAQAEELADEISGKRETLAAEGL